MAKTINASPQPRRGRPLRATEAGRLNLVIDRSLLDALRQRAKIDDRPVTSYMRRLIASHVGADPTGL